MILSLRDKMKHVFIVPIVRQVALDNVPLRNGPSSQKFSEGPMFIYYTVKIDHNYSNKMILLIEDYGILYKPPKWPVLYDRCIGKSMVVCNLWRLPGTKSITFYFREIMYICLLI